MQNYFPYEDSAAYVFADDAESVIHLIAERFIGENSPMPYVLRAFNEHCPASDKKGRYHFNFDERYPDADEETVCWAAGSLWCNSPRTSFFLVNCFGPTQVYLNGSQIFCSIGTQEGSGAENRFAVSLLKGENIFVIRCEKTPIGFGCTLANAAPQWEPCNFRSPFVKHAERMGFVFTAPSSCNQSTVLSDASDIGFGLGMQWLPEIGKPLEPEEILNEGFAYIWTSVNVSVPSHVTLEADTNVPIKLWIDGDDTLSGYGKLKSDASTKFGRLAILMCVKLKHGVKWGSLRVFADGAELPFLLPADVKGARGNMLYLGSFKNDEALPCDIMRFDRLYEGIDGSVYWRTQEKDVPVRPFVEAELYGRWTYPLGVTLYGILRAGEKFGRQDYCQYVRDHVAQTVKIHDYALYDKEKYGFPGVNHQLAWLDALDDCGSFGSLMMETEKKWHTEAGERIGKLIAEYISNEQIRLPDKAFYRGATMWADDMYMSVPFLIRYAQKTGKKEYIDDACHQLLLYRKHLGMEDCGLVSHIKSFRHDKTNRIPWSRGNGWVFFSLSQLLTVLDSDHEKRGEIIDFYNFLAEGYLRLQNENGLWHQVLNDSESYEESSATAMFLCAFVRGIIERYIRTDLAEKAASACGLAWKGLSERAVDKYGNIYGVCRGSGFSFSRSYYRTLSWNFNDTHGIGIIMLAGVEWINLKEHFLSANNC